MPDKYGNFVVGEVVRLRSLGPAMTVRRTGVTMGEETYGQHIQCDYFHGAEHMQVIVKPEQLEIHPDFPDHDKTPPPQPEPTVINEENIA